MGFYDHYVNRSRNALGLKAKLYQAKRIFDLAFKGTNRQYTAILELGPGDGYIAKLSGKNNCNYLGIEASEPVAAKLSKEGHNIIHSFVPPLPAGIGTFDVCYMLHVIEHMKDMDTATLLIRQIRTHLNNDGMIILACPDFIRWKHYFYDCDYTHSLPFTMRRLRQLLKNEGFAVSYESIYIGPVFGYWGLPIYWLARLLYPQFLDDFSSVHLKSDILNRGFLTLIPNLIVVAKKRKNI